MTIMYKVLPNINYTLYLSNIILHYIIGKNKLIRKLLFIIGGTKKVTTTEPYKISCSRVEQRLRWNEQFL